jgi:hypothetical protein
VQHLILADFGSDWSLAGSIMTFAIPVGLFVVVATILYFLYTRPHTVPGHRDLVPAGGRHTAGAPRHAAAQPPPVPPPPAAPPAGGTPGGGGIAGGGMPGDGGTPGAGGTPDGGGHGKHDGLEGMR